MLPKPCLIIITGHQPDRPSLANKLGKDLKFPVFSAEFFQENFLDIIQAFLKSNQSLILENNFNKNDSIKIQKLLKTSDFRTVQIHCSSPQTKKSQLSNTSSIKDSLLINADTSTKKSLNYKKLLADLKFATYYAFVERAFYAAGAFTLIFNKQGEILLCHRDDKNTWSPPGGIIDIDESPWHAATREVFEETGLKIKIDKLAGIYFRPGNQQDPRENLLFLFTCKSISGKLKLSRETSKLQFFPTDKLPKNLVPTHAERIKNYLKNPTKTILQSQKFPTN